MASVRQEISIDVSPEALWDAVRDVGALHTRLVAGFVSDCRLDGDVRTVTFAHGAVVRELIVDADDAARRLVWAAVGGRLRHHNASVQVFPDAAGRSRAVWIADFLPNALAPAITQLIDQGLTAMKTTLERLPAPRR